MTGVFGGGGRDLCPCGTGRAHDACCGALHRGERPAASAEELMRSRYAAYALGDTAYLLATWHPSTRPASVALDPAITWQRLEVLGAEDGQPGDEVGYVEFRAHFRHGSGSGQLHERSRFARRFGRWLYVDGDLT